MARKAESNENAPAGKPGADPRRQATRVRAGALAGALKDVRDVAGGGKDDAPILGDVVLEVADGTIRLTTTNTVVWAGRELASDDRDGPAVGGSGSADWLKGIRPFACAVPVKALSDIVGSFDADAMVTLELGDRLEVKAGRSRFRLATLPAEDMPRAAPLVVAHSFAMPASRLADSLHAVAHAISSEATRYYLCGVFIHAAADADGRELALRMAATDGHRLARLKQDAPDGAAAWPDMIVPAFVVKQLARWLAAAAKTAEGDSGAEVEVIVNDPPTLIRFEKPAPDDGRLWIVAKLIDGTFPEYARVIPPAGAATRAVLGRGALIEAIRRLSLIAPDQSRCVKAEFGEGTATLSIANAGIGEGGEELPCALTGPPVTIGFNGTYWREALAALAGDEVAIFLNGPGDPALLVDADAADEGPAGRFVQVLMPMKV